MKKFIFVFLAVFLMIPSIVSAHSGLTSSNPTQDQVLAGDLHEISLTFNTNIESLSTMKLLKDGNEIPISNIQVQEQQMKGSIFESLENGSYIIAWNIVGKDGHVIEGEIPFTVQKEQTAEETEDSTSSEDDEGIIQEESQTTKEENNDDQNQSTVTSEETKDQSETPSSNQSMILIIIGLVIILGVGLLLVSRKKR